VLTPFVSRNPDMTLVATPSHANATPHINTAHRGADAPRFKTTRRYHDRPSKAAFVYDKYRPILAGKRVLDVGADECFLKAHLPDSSSYWGVGIGGNPDQMLDLESGALPFDDNHFDTVLCLDVLEHLDRCHEVFDELCRVASGHVVVSLPGPMAAAWAALTQGRYNDESALKFYGLPVDRPPDRHRWFFSYSEAVRFVTERGRRNGMRLVQVESNGGCLREWNRLRRFAMRVLLHPTVDERDLFAMAMWAVLEKPGREG